MKVKKVIFALSVIVFGIICFIAGGKVNEIQYEDTMLYYYKKINSSDSLERSMMLRENKQLLYYGMKKEEVLAILPPPNGNSVKVLFDGDALMNLFWLYNSYQKKLRGTQDTVIVETYYWEIPYHDRPNLLIVFEKKDTSWIATTCVQWNPELVYID